MRDSITIERTFKAPIDRVFNAFTTPEDLVRWHHAGDGWQTPYAELDPRVGGRIKIGYADPEGKVVFDLTAVITEFDRPRRLAYLLTVGEITNKGERLITVDFTEAEDGGTHVRLEFDIEHINDKELQRRGWTEHVDNLQALLEA